MTLIDTSAWIEFFRRDGGPEVKRRVAAYIDVGESAYCGPVHFELMTGARPSEMNDVRAALSFSLLLDFPIGCWQRSAEVEKHLRAKGVTVPRDDILVAATAMHHGVPVYAHDPHFALMRAKGGLPLRLA